MPLFIDDINEYRSDPKIVYATKCVWPSVPKSSGKSVQKELNKDMARYSRCIETIQLPNDA